MKKFLTFAALIEVATGIIVLMDPPLVTQLLLNQTVAGAGVVMSRLAAITLIALGAACWPDAELRRGFVGMLTYSTLVMLLLLVAGVRGMAGIVLWPAVAFHAVESALLVWLRSKQERAPAAEVNG